MQLAQQNQPRHQTLTAAINGTLKSSWLIPGLFLGMVVLLLAHLLMPDLTSGIFNQIFSFKLIGLVCGLVGLIAYNVYFKFINRHITYLVYFYILIWPVLEYLGLMSDINYGINMHTRPICILGLAIPLAWMGLKHLKWMWRDLPHFRFVALFTVLFCLYYVFFNANVSGGATGQSSAGPDNILSLVQFFAYIYILLAIVAGAISLCTSSNPTRYFDQLNRWLLIVSTAFSIIAIIGYPFNFWCQNIDGFQRSTGVFSHPNPYAHHMGLILLYSFGLFWYYRGDKKSRMSSTLLWVSMGVNMVAFLLGLSKTGIAGVMLCTFIIIAFNMTTVSARRMGMNMALGALLIMPIVLYIFQAATGISFFDIIEARVTETTSLSWRTDVWRVLLDNMDLGSLIYGHGVTASNAKILQATYNDLRNAKPLMLVHNGYLDLLYNFGLPGMMMFIGVLALAYQSVRLMFSRVVQMDRALLTIIVSLCVYFLFCCLSDEMVYEYDAAQLFWMLSTMVFCLAWKEARRA